MTTPDRDKDVWLAFSIKLENGTWGVYVESKKAIKGDKIVIQAKSGKTWKGTLAQRETTDPNKWSYDPDRPKHKQIKKRSKEWVRLETTDYTKFQWNHLE